MCIRTIFVFVLCIGTSRFAHHGYAFALDVYNVSRVRISTGKTFSSHKQTPNGGCSYVLPTERQKHHLYEKDCRDGRGSDSNDRWRSQYQRASSEARAS